MIGRLTITIIIVFLGGCSASGPIFDGRKPPNESNGLIYLYRPSSFAGRGDVPLVYVNGDKKFKLRNGGHQFYDVPPGTHEIALSYPLNFRKNKIQVRVEEGAVVYVRLSTHASITGMPGVPVVTHPKLMVVTKAFAEQEISETKLSM